MEQEAEQVADMLLSGAPVPSGWNDLQAAIAGLGAPADPRHSPSPMGSAGALFPWDRLPASLSGVRLHTDAPAASSARGLGAAAYTHGSDVFFARRQYAPTTRAGTRLLAHELAHVVQHRHGRSPHVIHRQVAPPSPPVSLAPTDNVATFVLDPALERSSPPRMTTHLRVADPWAQPPRAPADIYVAIERRVLAATPVRVFAVPLPYVYDNPAEASTGEPEQEPRVLPPMQPGDPAFTRGGQFTVTAVAGDLAFSETPVPEAVGAAAVILVQTDAGAVLVDSGRQLRDTGEHAAALGEEVARRLLELMPVGQIDEAVLMPSAPNGWSVEQVAMHFPVRTVRTTPDLVVDARFAQTVDAVSTAQAGYRQSLEAQLRRSLEDGRSRWEADQAIAPNESIREQRWRTHVDQLVAETLGQLPVTTVAAAPAVGGALALPPVPEPAAAVSAEAVVDRTGVEWEPADDELIIVLGGGGLYAINSRGLLMRPKVPKAPAASSGPAAPPSAPPAATTVPGLRPTGPTGPTPVGARPSTPWIAASATGKAGQVMVRTGHGPGVLVDAGGAERFLPLQAVNRMVAELGVGSYDTILIGHPHADHLRAVRSLIVTHQIRAERFVTSATWNEAKIGPFDELIRGLRRATELTGLGYVEQWTPGRAIGTEGIGHATIAVSGGQVEVFTNPAAHDDIREEIRGKGKASAELIDSSSLLYIMGNETSSHRVAVLGDLRGTDILKIAQVHGPAFSQALTGVRVIVGFGHHLGPHAGTTDTDVKGYELLFRETLLRNGELTIVVQSTPEFAFGTPEAGPSPANALLEFAMSMGARVVFVGKPGEGGGGAVIRSDLTVGTYGSGVDIYAGDARVRAAQERLQMLREAQHSLSDPQVGPKQLRLEGTAAEIQARLAPEISRLESLLSDLLGRRAADLFEARFQGSDRGKAAFRAERSRSGRTLEEIHTQLAQQGPVEQALHPEVLEGLRAAVKHGSTLAVEAELLATPRGVSEAFARLPKERRESLERQYREIAETTRGMLDDQVPAEKRLEVLRAAELLREELKRAEAEVPAESKGPIDAEVLRMSGVVDTLMKDVETRTVTGRDAEGRPTTTEYRAIRQPDAVDKAFGRAGQLFGVMMVIHSVQGLAQVAAGAQEGKVNVAEAGFKIAESAYNLSIGIRSIRMAPVHPAEFAVVALLDFAAILSTDFKTTEQRNYALAVASVDQLCLAAGMAIMHGGSLIPHPIGRAAVMGLGFAVTLAGPKLLSLVGLDDWLARITGFPPGEVTHVYQDIQQTLDEYEVIIGAGALTRRTEADLGALGAGDAAALRANAEEARRRHTEKALWKERQLVALFHDAYDAAAVQRTGLRELDALAARFARLRHLAIPGHDYQDVLQRSFTAMDPQAGVFRDATPETIRGLDQWPTLDQTLSSLRDALAASPPSWDKIFEFMDKARQVMDNARYRVDSAGSGFRPGPMIAPGTPAYQTYVSMLAEREYWMAKLAAQAAEVGGAGGVFRPPSPSPTRYGLASAVPDAMSALSLLQSVRTAYDQRVTEISAALPELTRPETWANSYLLGQRLEQAHRAKPALFNGLRLTEMSLRQAIDQTRTALTLTPQPNPRLVELVPRETGAAEQAIERRRTTGLIFPTEIDEVLSERRRAEDRTLAALIDARFPGHRRAAPGAAPVPLSDPEIAALRTGELSAQGGKMSSTEHQLQKAWQLQSQWRELVVEPGKPIDLSQGSRTARPLLKLRSPSFWTYSKGWILDSADEHSVPSGHFPVFARVSWASTLGRKGLFSGPTPYLSVLAINSDALDLIGPEQTLIALESLAPLPAAELDGLDQLTAPSPARPAPAPVGVGGKP